MSTSHPYINRALITAAGPNMKALLQEYSLPSFQRYGRAQGYEVIAHDISNDGTGWDDASMAARWAKLGYLRQALAKYDLVVWIDADVLVCRTDDDIASHLGPDDFQGFVLEQVPTEHRINPNSGVWVICQAPKILNTLSRSL